jgi:hypothetical protein
MLNIKNLFKMKYITLILISYLSIYLISCQNSQEKNYPESVINVLQIAGSNANELEQVLNHYLKNPSDSLKYEAACFLIGNMGEKHAWVDYALTKPNGEKIDFDVLNYSDYESLRDAWDELETVNGELKFTTNRFIPDYDTISREFLIQNIELAFDVWENYLWAKHLNFDEFCAYILPHRSTNEALGNWRAYFKEKYHWLQDSMTDPTDPIEAAILINNDIRSWFSFDARYYEHPTDQSFEEMLSVKRGRCEDMTNLAIFAMRANGIAVTSDYTPYWANTGNNHAWNTILNKDGKISIFMGAEANPGEYKLSNRWAKVYRKTYAPQTPSLTNASGKPTDSLPPYINRTYYIDVTKEYGNVSDVIIDFNKSEEDIAYLCVFNSGEWKAIHWAKIVERKACFTDMAHSVLYLPAYYINNEIVPAGNPFILDKNGEFHPITMNKEIIRLEIDKITYRTTLETTDNIKLDNLALNTEYELFYWNNDWVWIDSKIYTGKELEFIRVPQKALFWLREKSGRKEERVFTLSADDQEQIYW